MLAQKIIFYFLKHCFFSFKGLFFALSIKFVKARLGLAKTLTLLLLIEEEMQRCFLNSQAQYLNCLEEKLKDKHVLLITARDEKWYVEVRQQLLNIGVATLSQGFISLFNKNLSQEKEQYFFSQGLDWQTEHFPSSGCFDYIVISPALSRLGHRAMFLRWLSQRYKYKKFILQLPFLQQSLYQNIRLYRGQRLATRHSKDKIVYQKESLKLDFGLWHELEELYLLKSQSLYQIILQEKVRPKKEYPLPFFSIIVPIYNVEKYLENCLESILRQTFNSFEVILVNDASPDNCQKIIDAYTLKDQRFRSFTHQYNQKQGSARNTGMQAATGDYLVFLDSDDLLHPACLETLAALAEDYSYQGIGFNSCEGRLLESVPGGSAYVLKRQLQNSGALANSYHTFSPWSKVIKRADKIPTFPKNRLYEDVVFSSITFLYLQQFLFVPVNLYYYRIQSASTMRKPFSWEQIENHCFMLKSMANFFTNRLASSLPLEFFDSHLSFLYNKLVLLSWKECQFYTLRMWRLAGMNYQKWFAHQQLQQDLQRVFRILDKDEKQAFSCLKKIHRKVKMYQKRDPQLQRNPLFDLFIEN